MPAASLLCAQHAAPLKPEAVPKARLRDVRGTLGGGGEPVQGSIINTISSFPGFPKVWTHHESGTGRELEGTPVNPASPPPWSLPPSLMRLRCPGMYFQTGQQRRPERLRDGCALGPAAACVSWVPGALSGTSTLQASCGHGVPWPRAQLTQGPPAPLGLSASPSRIREGIRP